MKKSTLFLPFLFLFISTAKAQTFTRADTLRGSLRPERTIFDVHYYRLSVDLNIPDRSIKGRVQVNFSMTSAPSKKKEHILQFDLFENMQVTSITNHKNEPVPFTREQNVIWVHKKGSFKKGEKFTLNIAYEGRPTIARQPPWDGGFVFALDKNKNPWVAVACEGMGASSWWPCKDHLSDEPDSMQIDITCDSSLTAISNGNLREIKNNGNKKTFSWAVTYPINSYNVTLNVGKYAHFSETFTGVETSYPLDYYVLQYNISSAQKHFTQVAPMLRCYESTLGPYPFPRDGYALVETPYLGMEHQSAIAYGNNYLKGYAGMDYSLLNLPFDYLIIHETGHEYWGNSISMQDAADMWIHESFCTYVESFYVECMYGADTALKYCNSWKYRVLNDKPVTGVYGMNDHGSTDMYYKGALMLHTLRYVVNNDLKWKQLFPAILSHFKYQTITGNQMIAYINEFLGNDYSWLFKQYLTKTSPPILNHKLVIRGEDLELTLRWDATDPDFRLPIAITTSPGKYETVVITPAEKTWTLKNMKTEDFSIDTEHAYFIIAYE